jgi:hypothetical protein
VRLPEANEFSPGQVDLVTVLQLAASNAADRDGLVEAIRARYFDDAAASRADPEEQYKQQRTRANNVLIGMKGYGLFELESSTLTDAGQAILDSASPADDFARHILLSCNGIGVLRAVLELQLRDAAVTKSSLQVELENSGFELPRATTHHTKLLQWLRCADVLPARGYDINQRRVEELSGVVLSEALEWDELSHPQKAFLITLRNTALSQDPEVAVPAKLVVSLATETYGKVFREDQLARTIFAPLAEQGWILLPASKDGRGGKSPSITAAPKLLSLSSGSIGASVESDLPAEVVAQLRKPLADVIAGLKSNDKHTKGIALEALAVRIASDLGVAPRRFRERGVATGGAEVDLIGEAAHLHFSRWLFQCKNTASVALSDLAKEIGMATLLKAHVVVMVTTGTFRSSVVEYSKEIARTTPLQVALLDGNAVEQYVRKGSPFLLEHFRAHATGIMKLKSSQVLKDADT